jgi:integrase
VNDAVAKPSLASSSLPATVGDGTTLYPRARARGGDDQAALFADEFDAARSYAKASRASSTQRAYASDWAIFTAWCDERGVNSLPADPRLVAVFLAAEASRGISVATVGRRLAAIGYCHREAGCVPPQGRDDDNAISRVLGGIRRTHGIKPKRKTAADGDIIRDLIRACDEDNLRAIRDRALLALGMSGAMRRSELVALDLEHIEFVAEGLRVHIGRSKTDQEGAGAVIAIPEGKRIRPKQLLLEWIAAAQIVRGPLFLSLSAAGKILGSRLSDRGVARVIKSRAAAVGLSVDDFSGHSLRAGFVTSAARHGASVFRIREVSRHKDLDVLADYVREAEAFKDHAGERFI